MPFLLRVFIILSWGPKSFYARWQDDHASRALKLMTNRINICKFVLCTKSSETCLALRSLYHLRVGRVSHRMSIAQCSISHEHSNVDLLVLIPSMHCSTRPTDRDYVPVETKETESLNDSSSDSESFEARSRQHQRRNLSCFFAYILPWILTVAFAISTVILAAKLRAQSLFGTYETNFKTDFGKLVTT